MKDNTFAIAFGRRLRQLRRLAGLTQVALAERSGVSLEHLNKIERGAAAPSLAAIEALHRALDLDPASLFLFDDPADADAGSRETESLAATRLGLFSLRPETDIIRAAPSLRRLLGYAGKTRREAAGDFLAAVFPGQAERIAAAMAALTEPGDRRLLVTDFVRRDGEARQGALALEMVREADSRGKLVVGVLTDVSERLRQQRLARREAAQIDRRVRERSARLERATERLRRENADLAADLRRFRGAFEHSPVGACHADPSGRILEANPALAALHGFASPGQMRREVGNITRDFLVDPARYEALRQLLQTTGQAKDFEAGVRRRDGTIVPTRQDIRAVADADGKLLYYEAFVQDSSAMDSAAHDLRRYARMIAASSDMVSLIDADGRYLFVNDAYHKAFGQPPSAIVGRHVADFLGESFYLERLKDKFARCLAGETLQFEHWTPLPGLGRRYLSVRYTPWTEGGDHRRIMVNIRDLTEARLVEEDLHESEKTTTILYRVSSAVASEEDMDSLYRTIRNILGEALDTHEFFIALAERETDRLRFVHFTSAAQPAPAALEDLARRLTPVTRDNIGDYHEADALIEVLRTAHPLLVTRRGMRLTGLTCPGRQPEVLLAVPIRVRQEVLGVMGVMHFADPGRFGRKETELMLSVAEQLALGVERRRNLDALRAAKEEADRANQAKSRFLASMSHEIRTPMNAILGLTEEVLKSRLSAEQHDYLDTVRDSARHLLGILNDVLDFSKIEAKRMVLCPEDFDPCELAGAVVKSFGLAAAAKGLRLTLEVAPGLPERVRGDDGKVRQILVNLVGNAVKFTDAGGVTVRLSPTPAGQGEYCRLAFSVADTGIGIPTAMQETIFDSFRQADDSTARRYGGTGLGLAISRELASLMGGELRVLSTPDQGSTFVFCAPFGKPSPPEHPDGATGERLTQPRGLHVLVAEDNPVNVKLMAIHLKKLGHTCVCAASGEEALGLLAAEPFDLVLMDIEMPGMDGLTAARRIRCGGSPEAPIAQSGLPIVAVTAHVSEEVRRACAEAGMDAYVGKPINLNELAGTIARLATARPASRPQAPPPAGPGPATQPDGVLDVAWALARLGIDHDLFAPILATSLEEFAKRLRAAEAALDAGDRAGLRLHAHTLKSTAATMGARDCLRLAGELEAAARESEMPPGTLAEILGRLDQAWETAAAAARNTALGRP
ncbi:MAG: PAS domain S-box protein [Solidesulfovibrio sp. DCME]|uniref:PAS domain S-box protein n=1 Tax=Solidesulfovibrio sp. DCME TaxID=3447380 RepID=UPI003D11587C